MKFKRVLIIAYYWPPSGGGGVQRWVKFVKYLRQFGWEPVVYTPEIKERPAADASLLNQIPEGLKVIKMPIREPYKYYKLLTGRSKNDRVYSGFLSEKQERGFADKVAMFIRGNFFIPDARRAWIRPSIRFLRSYVESESIDAMISTGPPHSMHLIAMGVAAKHAIPWITDFRDPWTNIDFYGHLRLLRCADARHRRLERRVLQRASKVVTVSPSWVADFARISGRSDITLITNGYDPADFQDDPGRLDDLFTICHSGSMNQDRNPQTLWRVLAKLCDENRRFKDKLRILLIGQVDITVRKSIHQYKLDGHLEKSDFLPHDQLIRRIRRAQLLLLTINATANAGGIIPGKLFEYLAAGRPIFCVGPPEQDAAQILRTTRAGTCWNYDDFAGMEEQLKNLFSFYQENRLNGTGRDYEGFSREQLAGQYAQLLDSVVLITD